MLNAEDNIDEQQRRMSAACEVMGIQANTLADQLLTIKAERLVLVQRDPQDGKIKTTPLYGQLLALIRDRQIGVLIVDPLNAAAALNRSVVVEESPPAEEPEPPLKKSRKGAKAQRT